MKIIRVLNTNAVLSKDGQGEEIILLGAGVGFKRRPGDEVDACKVEKRFVLKDREKQDRFQKLINNIPEDYILVAEQIIALGVSRHHMKLNESIHISLADHIHTSIENMKLGISIPNTIIYDIRSFYQNEFELGSQGLLLIREKLGYQLPEDEAAFIAMHFINAQYGSENANVKKTVEFIREINEMIMKELKVTPDKDSLNYYRYMTHLKFFAQRVMTNYHYDDDAGNILDMLVLRYHREYACSKKVSRYIKEKYHYKIGQDELIYLTVHLAHLTR